MRRISLLIAMLLLPAFLQADAHAGKMFYMKHLKSKIKMSGAEFARLHTCDEWVALFRDDGKGFIEEFSSRFPKRADYFNSGRFKKHLGDLADFAIRYASDSGNTPSCGEERDETPPELAPNGMSKGTLF